MKYTIDVNTPAELSPKSVLEKIFALSQKLHEELGNEEFEMRLQLIFTQWGLESGYKVKFDGQKIVFTHVSI